MQHAKLYDVAPRLHALCIAEQIGEPLVQGNRHCKTRWLAGYLANAQAVWLTVVLLPSCPAGLNKKYVTNQLTAAAAASATAQETLAGIRTVKSFAKEQHIISM